MSYSSIFQILKDSKINAVSDLLDLSTFTPMSWGEKGTKGISSDRYPWVGDVFEEIDAVYNSLLTSYVSRASPKLLSERMYDPLMASSWKMNDLIFQYRATLSCLFPNNLLYFSHQFIKYDTGAMWIPLDFFALLFSMRPALLQGISTLLPNRMRFVYDGKPTYWDETPKTAYYTCKNEVDFVIPASGAGHEDLKKEFEDYSNIGIENRLIFLPWVQGLDINHYVDLIMSNPETFNMYSRSLGRFFGKNPASEGSIVDWAMEVEEGIQRLNFLFAKEQKKQKDAGREIALGLSATLLTFLLPPSLANLQATLAAILGGSTVVQGLSWLRNRSAAMDVLNSDPMWCVWRANDRKRE